MRATLNKFIRRNPDIILLHCDMWGFDCPSINCGIQEPNMVNVAAGLAYQGKRVVVYGVAGFGLFKGLEHLVIGQLVYPMIVCPGQCYHL